MVRSASEAVGPGGETGIGIGSPAARVMEEVGAYHGALVERLGALLGPELVGVYAGGSFAVGDFDSVRSDLDVTAVCRRGLDRATKGAVVEALRHESLACPARGLELVVYGLHAVETPSLDAAFELNLNTGERMPFRADLAPGEERHWFAIDRAILRAHGVTLVGPPAGAVFAHMPRRLVLDALGESIRWHEDAESEWSNAVLNACRALRFAEGGVWSSKSAAADWARSAFPDGVIDQALAARGSDGRPRPAGVAPFLQAVESAIGSAARRSGGRAGPGV